MIAYPEVGTMLGTGDGVVTKTMLSADVMEFTFLMWRQKKQANRQIQTLQVVIEPLKEENKGLRRKGNWGTSLG